MGRCALVLTIAMVAVFTLAAAGARAADPGRWVLSQEDQVKLAYFQGLTHDPLSRLFFVGVFKGGYRTDAALGETARTDSLIPADVESAVGFNHVGDPTFDGAEGGRLILPLECYRPGAPNGGNTCGLGGLGVTDPQTLGWRYWVRLDQADIAKAMWAETSPDGSLVWTSSGRDLLAYATADVAPSNAAAAPDSPPIRPVTRLVGAVPPSGVTGAAFADGLLLLAGEDAGVLQVWSVDVSAQTPARLELELPGVRAEPEGLDLVDSRGGLLHWLLSPFAANPTYGTGHSELLTFVPKPDARLALTVAPRRLRPGRPTLITVRVRMTFWGRPHPVAGARVTAAGRSALTGPDGVARLRIASRRTGLTVRAMKLRLRPASARVAAPPR